MKIKLFLIFARYLPFWDLRYRYLKFLFSRRKNLFNLENAIYNIKSGANTFNELVFLSLKIFLSSLLVAILIQLGEYYLTPYIITYLHQLFNFFDWNLVNWGPINSEEYVTFLATISSIAGIIIGLYYASISVISSTAYVKVPESVKLLLLIDRAGNFYLNFLAFLAFLGILLIGFQLLAFPRSYFAVVVMLFLSGVGIGSFFGIGKHVMSLSNPTRLSIHIFQEFSRYLEHVIPKKNQWQDPAFQSYAHRNAFKKLNTLEELSDFISKQKHLQGKDFIKVSGSTLEFLYKYEKYKQRIPSSSLWYEQKGIHKDWYKENQYSLEMHVKTGTFTQPKEIADKEWVEKTCLPIIMQCLKINISNKNYMAFLSIHEIMEDYAGQLASNGYVDRGVNFSNDLMNVALESFIKKGEEKPSKDDRDLGKLLIIQYFAILPIKMVLAYTKSLTRLNHQNIKKTLSSVDWSKDKNIYNEKLSGHAIEKMEWLLPRMKFEKDTEGKIITPLWHITENICEAEARNFVLSVEIFVNQGGEFYANNLKISYEAKRYFYASTIASMGIEYWSKFENSLNDLEKAWDELSSARRMNSLKWPELSFKKLNNNINKRKNKLLLQVAKLTYALREIEHDDNYPDYKGQFLHYLADNIVNLLIDNNKEIVEKIFLQYLECCFCKYFELLPQNLDIENWQNRQNLKTSIRPLLDLMEISGYAKLMSDYHDSKFLWEYVKSIWDKYIEAGDRRERNITILTRAITLYSDSLEGLHYLNLHYEWRMRIHTKFQTIERCAFPGHEFVLAEPIINHKSALVRVFATDDIHDYSGVDIFSHFYLQRIENNDAFNKFDSPLGLKNELAHNEEEYEKYMESIKKQE